MVRTDDAPVSRVAARQNHQTAILVNDINIAVRDRDGLGRGAVAAYPRRGGGVAHIDDRPRGALRADRRQQRPIGVVQIHNMTNRATDPPVGHHVDLAIRDHDDA